MNTLKGKKLLYLGGISRARFVVERARKLGVYVIVADYNENSPAKAVADEGVLVDAMDVEALVAVCNNKSIDGIMTGYCDILLPVCMEVANIVGIPCYYTENMLRFTTDKDFFKEVCLRYSVPVPARFEFDSSKLSDVAVRLPYPVFIKPMDASGSRGASACYGKDEFDEKYAYALENSRKGLVSVEEYLDGTAFILDYVVNNGCVRLQSMADCYVRPGRPAAVNSPDLMILPSRELKRYRRTIDKNVQSLIKGENFKNGLFFFQGKANESRLTLFEAGCRLGGTWPYIDEHYSTLNPMDMLFSYALTGVMSRSANFDKICAEYSGKAAIIYFLARDGEGEIAIVDGVAEVRELPWVVHVMQYYSAGDKFDTLRRTDVRFLAVHLVANDFDQLRSRVKVVYSKIKYLGSGGENLLAPSFDIDSLDGCYD